MPGNSILEIIEFFGKIRLTILRGNMVYQNDNKITEATEKYLDCVK